MIFRLRLFLKILPFLLLIFVSGCNPKSPESRQVIDLSGIWQFSPDTADEGIREKWYETDLTDSLELPGTTDLRQKGYRNTDTTTMHLNRLYYYQGPAWYRKKISIPEAFEGKHITLILERTKPSMVWVDNLPAGGSDILQTPQNYDLSEFLTPGEHVLTIRINNDLRLTPYGNVHIYSDDTQTNWNGIIGKIRLEASEPVFISDLQVFPDIEKRKIDIKIGIDNPPASEKLRIELGVNRKFQDKNKKLKTVKYEVPADTSITLAYDLDDEMLLWDEHQQPLYELTARIKTGESADSRTVPFGMRKFTAKGTRFEINGRSVFLRGKHDACVFPLTGFPPMDTDGWIRVFRKAKLYGINHYRFHSWCPPEAAFEAADREGIYLQPELPFWGGLESDTTAGKLLAEGMAMLRNYANHPSFVLFSHGNEIWSGHDRVERNIIALKSFDARPLYTMGSNNNIGYAAPRDCSDFFVAARAPSAGDTILTHTRLTHAFADSRDGGILNTQIPSTEITYDYAVSQIKIPVISHETGQYQTYPDYDEINKYTGVLKAWNLEIFRERLKKSGMYGQDKEFHKASGAWAALCYKAEMEAALRTKGLAGFQLLDLQDFPGQGTALVGILDAFMDDKGVIDRTEWLQSCNDVVLLLKFPRYCWTNAENFQAEILVANYSGKMLKDDLSWTLINRNGKTIKSGVLKELDLPDRGLLPVGSLNITLSEVSRPEKLRINLKLKTSGYSNSYPVWVYPVPESEIVNKSILITEKLDDRILNRLQNGEKVLLFPTAESVKSNSIGGLFPPEFWNYGMFKGISEWVGKPVSPGTLGILTNPDHPLFNSFPTDFHTNWQWFTIIKSSNPLILNKTAADYRPIVQVIDNLERNYKLGLIFEFVVGSGKLLVCMSRLNEIQDKPEASALYNSIINYMESDSFNPSYRIDEDLLMKLLN